VTSPTPAIAAVASHAQAAAHAHCTVVDVTLRYVTRQCDTHRTGHARDLLLLTIRGARRGIFVDLRSAAPQLQSLADLHFV